jgi:hypothetical protein
MDATETTEEEIQGDPVSFLSAESDVTHTVTIEEVYTVVLNSEKGRITSPIINRACFVDVSFSHREEVLQVQMDYWDLITLAEQNNIMEMSDLKGSELSLEFTDSGIKLSTFSTEEFAFGSIDTQVTLERLEESVSNSVKDRFTTQIFWLQNSSNAEIQNTSSTQDQISFEIVYHPDLTFSVSLGLPNTYDEDHKAIKFVDKYGAGLVDNLEGEQITLYYGAEHHLRDMITVFRLSNGDVVSIPVEDMSIQETEQTTEDSSIFGNLRKFMGLRS